MVRISVVDTELDAEASLAFHCSTRKLILYSRDSLVLYFEFVCSKKKVTVWYFDPLKLKISGNTIPVVRKSYRTHFFVGTTCMIHSTKHCQSVLSE